MIAQTNANCKIPIQLVCPPGTITSQRNLSLYLSHPIPNLAGMVAKSCAPTLPENQPENQPPISGLMQSAAGDSIQNSYKIHFLGQPKEIFVEERFFGATG
jgi:hypothetical protein